MPANAPPSEIVALLLRALENDENITNESAILSIRESVDLQNEANSETVSTTAKAVLNPLAERIAAAMSIIHNRALIRVVC